MRRPLVLLALVAVVLAACTSASSSGATTAAGAPAAETTSAAVTTDTTGTATTEITPAETATPDSAVVDTVADPDRPYEVFVPSSYDPATPMPLVILLHGFGATGDIQEGYFQLQPLAESRGFLYVHPDGTLNQIGRQFWNATPACCGFNSQVDDVAYVLSIIDGVSADYQVDPKRVFLMGHSNGGFMSYRMACEAAGRISAVASLAGATFLDPADCAPSEPVSVLQVHGTADETIGYDGGTTPIIDAAYPGARQTVSSWAQYDGCDPTATPAADGLDLDQTIPGTETAPESFDGCPAGIDVVLWTVEGGSHIPDIATATPPYPLAVGMIDFLLSHPKA